MEWQLGAYLDRYNRTHRPKIWVSDIVEKTGLSSNTVYPISRGEAQRVDRETLSKIIQALRELTGESIEVSDLLKFEVDKDA